MAVIMMTIVCLAGGLENSESGGVADATDTAEEHLGTRMGGPMTSGFWERMDLPLDQMDELAELFQGVIDETDDDSHLGLGNLGDLLERLADDMEAMGKRRKLERSRSVVAEDDDAWGEPSLAIAISPTLRLIVGGVLALMR